jgi:XTP/dITP diphosphohydrolase
MVVLVASNNPHKLAEFRGMLEPFKVLAPVDVGVELDVAETGSTFAENARLKAEAFCRATGLLTLADDSGLVVDALGGEPGVYSARYGGTRSDRDRLALVLERLGAVPDDRRTARFVAAIALARPGHETELFEASVEGTITREPRGQHGFGYDPIFVYPPAGRTFAEMEQGEKARVSHRGKALRQAVNFLSKLGFAGAASPQPPTL